MRDKRGAAGTSAGRGNYVSDEVPIRSAWAFSGLRIVLVGVLVPMVLIAVAVIWAMSRPGVDAPKLAIAAALDCTSSRDAWRWACQQDKLGRDPPDPAVEKHDAITTGSVEPSRRRPPATQAAAADLPAAETASNPALDAPKPTPRKVVRVEPQAPLEAKPGQALPGGNPEPIATTVSAADPGSTIKAPDPVTTQVAAAPGPAPVAAPAAQEPSAWTDPVPSPDGSRAEPQRAELGPAKPVVAPIRPAQAQLAALSPGAVGSVTPSTAARAPIPTRAAAAESERRPAARPPVKAEKPVRVARPRPIPERRDTRVAEREEPAVVPRAPTSMRVRAARAVMTPQALGVGPALRVTSTETHILPDGRRVTMNVAPSSDVVRQLVQAHTRSYASPRTSRPYWDW